MVTIPFYGNTLTDSFSNPLEILVGDFIMNTSSEWDGLFIIGLLILIIYLFSYIRRHK